MPWEAEIKEIGRFRDAAKGLESAAKALQAAADDHEAEKAEYGDDDEMPQEKQPKSLKEAASTTRDALRRGRAKMRGEKSDEE